MEWGRNRNIDGIPELMVEGEFEWWEPVSALLWPSAWCIPTVASLSSVTLDMDISTALKRRRCISRSLLKNRCSNACRPTERWNHWTQKTKCVGYITHFCWGSLINDIIVVLHHLSRPNGISSDWSLPYRFSLFSRPLPQPSTTFADPASGVQGAP